MSPLISPDLISKDHPTPRALRLLPETVCCANGSKTAAFYKTMTRSFLCPAPFGAPQGWAPAPALMRLSQRPRLPSSGTRTHPPQGWTVPAGGHLAGSPLCRARSAALSTLHTLPCARGQRHLTEPRSRLLLLHHRACALEGRGGAFSSQTGVAKMPMTPRLPGVEGPPPASETPAPNGPERTSWNPRSSRHVPDVPGPSEEWPLAWGQREAPVRRGPGGSRGSPGNGNGLSTTMRVQDKGPGQRGPEGGSSHS